MFIFGAIRNGVLLLDFGGNYARNRRFPLKWIREPPVSWKKAMGWSASALPAAPFVLAIALPGRYQLVLNFRGKTKHCARFIPAFFITATDQFKFDDRGKYPEEYEESFGTRAGYKSKMKDITVYTQPWWEVRHYIALRIYVMSSSLQWRVTRAGEGDWGSNGPGEGGVSSAESAGSTPVTKERKRMEKNKSENDE